MRYRVSVFVLLGVVAACSSGSAEHGFATTTSALSPPVGTWTVLANTPPDLGTPLLLTDGTVLLSPPFTTNQWFRLTPDASGSYVNGTWSTTAAAHDARSAFGSAVLADGRVFVAGGEYGTGGTTAEIYDPRRNTWTYVPTAAISGGGAGGIHDATTITEPDGRVMVFPVLETNAEVYDPVAGSWNAPVPSKLYGDVNTEESYAKLPDGTILTADIWDHTPLTQKYVPSANRWVTAGTLPAPVADATEIGPVVQLYDGRAFFLGATGNTALYTPPSNPLDPGTWQQGPTLPNGSVAGDVPAAVMPNGRVLFYASTPQVGGFLEYDPISNTYATAPTPPGTTGWYQDMVVLPTGQVLIVDPNGKVAIYTPSGGPAPGWMPTISSVTDRGNGSYLVQGGYLNGWTEGAYFGDDGQSATNFPLVRLVDGSGVVRYARTFGFSSMGVAVPTGSFSFTVPGVPAGSYSLSVIANGIASAPVAFTVQASALPCNDGVRNGNETDVDCGGSCVACSPGQACVVAADCGTSNCVSGVCVPPCADGARDGLETDVDCGGGVCGGCGPLQHCQVANDCASQVCVSGTCQAPSCTDHVRNQHETDVDCGGPNCSPCAIGQQCTAGHWEIDCQNLGGCPDGVCQAPNCTDGIRNANETGVDCGGGTCGACPLNQGCATASDCLTHECTGGVCTACNDGIRDGYETDTDCGGGLCGPCALGKACVQSVRDCQGNGGCIQGVCTAPTCTDQVKDGNETDVDCGGGTCSACANGGSCLANSDCQSGLCSGGHCVPIVNMVGSSELANFTLDLTTTTSDPNTPLCRRVGGLVFQPGSPGDAESAMLAASQPIAPMASFLDKAACAASGAAGAPSTASGFVVGLSALSIVGAQSTAGSAACNGAAADCDPTTDPQAGLAWSTTVQRPTKGSYTFHGWQDVLRVLYGGASNDPNDTGCNSEIRRTIASQWPSAFQAPPGCTTGQCSRIRHIFRPDDGSDAAIVFASLLGLTPVPSASALNGFGTSPYCNAMNWDTSPANALCAAGPAKQYVGPGGVDDGTGTGHHIPPPGAYGTVPLGAQPSVFPTSYQDNDPIRVACLGAGSAGRAGEDVCNADGTLGLVLPIPDLSFIPSQHPGLTAFTTGPSGTGLECNGAFVYGAPPNVFLCAIRSNGTVTRGLCPNNDAPQTFGCMIPTGVTPSGAVTSQCMTRSGVLPACFSGPCARDGRVYNLQAYDGTGADGVQYLNVAIPETGFTKTLPFTGAFARIHEREVGVVTTPPSAQPCQLAAAGPQIACLTQASPCSLGLTGAESIQPGTAGLKIGAIDPTPTCTQNQSYAAWNKLYLNSVVGFSTLGTSSSRWLASCEATGWTINAPLAQFGFTQLPFAAFGEQYCEDFDEQTMCGASSNTNACATNPSGGVSYPTTTTTCGNGVVEMWEDCDNGAANGPPPASCSSICRTNPQ